MLIGGVSLVKGRIREAGPVMREICDELEPRLVEAHFGDNAPFRTVSLIIRFGERANLTPEYAPIDKRHGELPVAIEMQMDRLRTLDRAELKDIFERAVVDVLAEIARKYGLPSGPVAKI